MYKLLKNGIFVGEFLSTSEARNYPTLPDEYSITFENNLVDEFIITRKEYFGCAWM